MFKKLKVGPNLYTVRRVAAIENDSCNPDGQWSFDTKVGGLLQIKNDIENDVVEAEVVTHEVLHALFYHFNIEQDNEEHLVQTLAHGLTMVMKDNPRYLAYLTEKLK